MIALPDIGLRFALCGLVGASLVWEGLPVLRHSVGIVATPAILVTVPEAAEQSVTKPADLTPVLTLAPFGRNAVLAGQNQLRDGAVLPDFSLHGIIVASSNRRSVALISVDEGQALYRQGDPIAGSGRVDKITLWQVRIQISGRDITLFLDDTSLLAEADISEPTQGAAKPLSLHERMRANAVVATRTARAEPPETPEQYIDYWRQRIRKNPVAVMQAIGLRPSNGGYVIAENHDSGVRLAGLRAGDLVRSVNGQTVGDPDNDRRFYDQFAASGHARLEVQRGDDILTFSFPLR